MLKGFMVELVARGQHSSKLVELNNSLLSICTWPGVYINSWLELELLSQSGLAGMGLDEDGA